MRILHTGTECAGRALPTCPRNGGNSWMLHIRRTPRRSRHRGAAHCLPSLPGGHLRGRVPQGRCADLVRNEWRGTRRHPRARHRLPRRKHSSLWMFVRNSMVMQPFGREDGSRLGTQLPSPEEEPPSSFPPHPRGPFRPAGNGPCVRRARWCVCVFGPSRRSESSGVPFIND